MEQKNEKVATLRSGQAHDAPDLGEEARVIETAARILDKYRAAFEELAK